MDATLFRPPAPVENIGRLFEAAGHEVRMVGGWVRDTLSGVEPKDLDLATTATPDQMIEIFNQHNLRYWETGLQHGTLTVLPTVQVKDGPDPRALALDFERAAAGQVPNYEITTLRVDSETDGRHAKVEFTTDWRSDAARRDFTINAMSANLNGEIYDYFGGIDHLANKRIVFVGDPSARIQEDYLRILRYFRFRSRIGDRVFDRDALKVIQTHVEGLERLSVERVWMEMSKILTGDPAMLCLILIDMFETKVLENIGFENIERYDIVRSSKVRDRTANPITVLAAMTELPISVLWKMSRPEIKLLDFLQKERVKGRPSLARLKDIAFDSGHDYAIETAALLGNTEDLRLIRDWAPPDFPVRGADLIEMGRSPGVEIGQILDRLTQVWKGSDYKMNKKALLSMV